MLFKLAFLIKSFYKMKQRKDDFFEGFITAIFFSIIAAWILEENQNRKKRLQTLRESMNKGIENDIHAIEGDWKSIFGDIRYAYGKQLEENNL